MEAKFTREFTILPGACDNTAALSVPGAFTLFMDIATEHACDLGCGIDVLSPRGLFWLTVRTRVRFFRRPKMLERVSLTTWPEQPGKLRANRDYLLTSPNGTTLVAGRTEWAVLNTETGRLDPMEDVFVPGTVFTDESVLPAFTRLNDEPLEEFARHTVRSADIDLGGHMNNVAYVRALAGAFSCEAWQAMDVQELEIAYRNPCYEGETLSLQKRDEGGTLLLRAALPDDKTVILAKLTKG